MSIGLATLFVSGFLAATLLPGGSEPLLLAYLLVDGARPWWPDAALAIAFVGVGNTLGGLLTYGMGRGVRVVWGRWQSSDVAGQSRAVKHQRAAAWLDRWGPWALLMSWVPVVGDPLCLVAGAMRLPVWASLTAMAIGKFARYGVMTAVTLYFA